MLLLGLFFLVCSQVALAKTVYYDWSIDWVTASPDGYSRPVIGINGKWPCPQIDVDLNDRLVVTIHNNLGNESTGLHWHGINQYGHATMDGSAGAAQCPVPPNSSFTYDFPVCNSDSRCGNTTDSHARSIKPALTGTIHTPKANTLTVSGGRSLSMIRTFPIISMKRSP